MKGTAIFPLVGNRARCGSGTQTEKGADEKQEICLSKT